MTAWRRSQVLRDIWGFEDAKSSGGFTVSDFCNCSHPGGHQQCHLSLPRDFLHSCPESLSVTSRKKGGRPLGDSAPSSWSAVVPMGCRGHCVVPFPSSVHSKVFAFKPRPHLCHLPILAGTIALRAGMAPAPCRPWSGCLSFLTPAA